jgi:hypothetical protein
VTHRKRLQRLERLTQKTDWLVPQSLGQTVSNKVALCQLETDANRNAQVSSFLEEPSRQQMTPDPFFVSKFPPTATVESKFLLNYELIASFAEASLVR